MPAIGLNAHKRNKSSVASASSFVVNSVVKQFDNYSEEDGSDESNSDKNDTSANLNNDYSSLYAANSTDPNFTHVNYNADKENDGTPSDGAKPEGASKINTNDVETTESEVNPSSSIKSISLPTNIFDILQPDSKKLKNSENFHEIFSNSCIVKSEDDCLLKSFIAIVYNVDKKPNTFSCFIIDKFGCTFHKNLDISPKSKYYEAIHNLPPKHFDLNVSKSIAAAVLQKYAYILEKYPSFIQNKDQLNPVTAAKSLDKCELIDTDNIITPLQICLKIQQFCLINERQIFSNFVDVVYDTNSLVDKMEQNNYLVSFLGDQLEQLFNPLTEYSPEEMEQVYKPDHASEHIQESEIVESIIKEFISVQTYLTIDLVKFLTKFIIPLRIAITKQKLSNLTITKFNAIFPPTIDEVTRINCIFLDALKISSEYSLKELIKSVYQTIQYFYKAYTRHEAATKNFNPRLNQFLKEYNISDIVDTNVYTALKIDTIINGPQEKLFKIKLILERLIKEKEKENENSLSLETKQQYDHILDIIDQFGLSSISSVSSKEDNYQQRVFTPSGKILTELATNWPIELQYKWLKRKVVGIFDCINEFTGLKNCIVIFSDYIVCLEVLDDYDILNNPLISDILMNSLINEKPLPMHFPKLRVFNYCEVSKTLITAYGGKGQIRVDLLNDEKPLYLQLINPTTSTEYICELVTKACILCKSSAFHLFKQVYNLRDCEESETFKCYVTAHDLSNFQKEKVKSPFAIFLNIEVDQDILVKNDVYYGFFVNPIDDINVEIKVLSQVRNFEKETILCETKDFNQVIIEKLTNQYFIEYYYSLNSPLIKQIISINELIVAQIQEPLTKLKQSVLLNKREMQRFSTIMNPNSPLVKFSPQKTLPDNNSYEKTDNNKLQFISIPKSNATKEKNPPTIEASQKTNPALNIVSEKSSIVNGISSSNSEVKTKKVVICNENTKVIPKKIIIPSATKKDISESTLGKPSSLTNANVYKTAASQLQTKPTPKTLNKEKRKKNRLSSFFANIFGKKKKTVTNEKKTEEKNNIKIKEKPLPKKPIDKTRPLDSSLPKVQSDLSPSKKSFMPSPAKEDISSPIKIQRETYKEGDIPRLNSNLEKKLFRESIGPGNFPEAIAVKNASIANIQSPFVDESDVDTNAEVVEEKITTKLEENYERDEYHPDYFDGDSSGNSVEIGEAFASPVSQTFNAIPKFVYSPNSSKHSIVGNDDSLIYEENGNNKVLKISQSPSFRELFLKLESDLKPLSTAKKPNYWTGNTLFEAGLENSKENKTKASTISNLYDSIIFENEEENENSVESASKENAYENQPPIITPVISQNEKMAADIAPSDETFTEPGLKLNTKFEKLSSIPKHSPLETHFPSNSIAEPTSFDAHLTKPERYGNKFKVVRHQESLVSPVKSDFVLSPTKTPEVKSYNDDITDDIKTMTLDGVNLDIVSPIQKSLHRTQSNGNRIVSDLKIDFDKFLSVSNNYNSNDFAADPQLQPNSPLLAVLKQDEKSKSEVAEKTTNSNENPVKGKKFNIRSESFGYLSEFI